MLNSGELKEYYEIDPKNSWMIGGGRTQHADGSSGMGGFNDGKHLCFVCLFRRAQSFDDEERH
jgi:hypothetical protein